MVCGRFLIKANKTGLWRLFLSLLLDCFERKAYDLSLQLEKHQSFFNSAALIMINKIFVSFCLFVV